MANAFLCTCSLVPRFGQFPSQRVELFMTQYISERMGIKEALEKTLPLAGAVSSLLLLALGLEGLFQASKASYFSRLTLFEQLNLLADVLFGSA